MAKQFHNIRRRIKTRTVCAKTGSSRWTLNRWVETSGFPKPHKLGPSPDNIWFEDEVDAWIEAHGEKMAPPEMRTPGGPFRISTARAKKTVTCDRTVLFLRRTNGAFETASIHRIRDRARGAGSPKFHEDDITISVEDRGNRCILTGESRSRHGYGDLGQNPRNLRRIIDEIRIVVEDEKPGEPRP